MLSFLYCSSLKEKKVTAQNGLVDVADGQNAIEAVTEVVERSAGSRVPQMALNGSLKTTVVPQVAGETEK